MNTLLHLHSKHNPIVNRIITRWNFFNSSSNFSIIVFSAHINLVVLSNIAVPPAKISFLLILKKTDSSPKNNLYSFNAHNFLPIFVNFSNLDDAKYPYFSPKISNYNESSNLIAKVVKGMLGN